MRRVAVQARMDKVVDNLIEAERSENFAMQQAVFTTVSLFLSTFFVALFKPHFWDSLGLLGRGLVLTLFVFGLRHLFTRLRAYFRRYTYRPDPIHDSITREPQAPSKPFTRFTASSFLIIGYAASFGIGLLLNEHMSGAFLRFIPGLGGPSLQLELLFYPPIAVLVVDTMHTVAAKID